MADPSVPSETFPILEQERILTAAARRYLRGEISYRAMTVIRHAVERGQHLVTWDGMPCWCQSDAPEWQR